MAARGHDLYVTGFYEWTAEGKRLFNCVGDEILRERIEAELADPGGKRAFHPVRKSVDVDAVVEAVA